MRRQSEGHGNMVVVLTVGTREKEKKRSKGAVKKTLQEGTIAVWTALISISFCYKGESRYQTK